MRASFLLCLCVPIAWAVAPIECQAAPPEAPRELKVEPGQLLRIVVKGTKVGVGRDFSDSDAFVDELVSTGQERRFVFQATKPGVYTMAFVTVGEAEIVFTKIVVGRGTPAPKPEPAPPPKPKPADPLTSFRVFIVYESADSLTVAQRAVVYGKAVQDYLDANCTGGKAGWRRRDKDAPGEGDPAMKPLWDAIKPALTKTPCMAIERNGKVTLVDLDATPEKMIETLNRYKNGGK